MKKILAIMLSLILCLSFVVACSDENGDEGKTALDKTIIGTVDGVEISQAEYNCYYYVYYSQYSQYSMYYGEEWMDQDMGDGQTLGELIKTNAKAELEEFVVMELMAKERYGITADDVKKNVDAQFEELINSYGSKAAFAEFLISAHTTEKALRKYFERYEIYTLLAEKMSGEGGEIQVTDEEVKSAFESQYSSMLKVQHILISTVGEDGVTPTRTDDEALAIATEVLAKLDEGAEFDSLIDTYDEDPGMTPGYYYVFGEGEMVPEFETASKELAIGEYTKQAVKTSYGYHIIKRYPLDESSDEYNNTRIALVQEKLYPVVEEEVKNKSFDWDNEAMESYIEIWLAEMATANSTSVN